jgi:HEAT repeat protein
MDNPTLQETLDLLGAHTPEELVALLRDPDDETAGRACWALGHLGDEPHSEEVLELLESDRPGLWMQSAATLSMLESKYATQRLIALVRDGAAPPAQRTAAAYALAFAGDVHADPHHAEPIRQAFTDLLGDAGEPPALRAQAAEGLANMLGGCGSDPARDEQAARDEAGRLLQAALADADPEVRFWSAFALGSLAYAPALPALRELAARDRAHLDGWWTVGEEASDAVDRIEGREPPERIGRPAAEEPRARENC